MSKSFTIFGLTTGPGEGRAAAQAPFSVGLEIGPQPTMINFISLIIIN